MRDHEFHMVTRVGSHPELRTGYLIRSGSHLFAPFLELGLVINDIVMAPQEDRPWKDLRGHLLRQLLPLALPWLEPIGVSEFDFSLKGGNLDNTADAGHRVIPERIPPRPSKEEHHEDTGLEGDGAVERAGLHEDTVTSEA